MLQFYRVYHSSRYVGDELVMRINGEIDDERLADLNDEFARIVRSGRITRSAALDVEVDHLDLPRLVFTHTRSNLGLVRQLIDRINEYATPATLPAARSA